MLWVKLVAIISGRSVCSAVVYTTVMLELVSALYLISSGVTGVDGNAADGVSVAGIDVL